MTEHPILFSGPMVRAILSGAKTQTRRVVKPQPPAGYDRVVVKPVTADAAWADDAHHRCWPDHRESAWICCPYGARGDRLWVKTYHWRGGTGLNDQVWDEWTRITRWKDGTQTSNVGLALDADDRHWLLRCRPSIQMPRWASRITLEIDEVRVQRVQEITEEDALDEGVTPRGMTRWQGEARGEYRLLWDALNAKRGFPWDINPWVWAIAFHRVEEPR